MLSPVPTSDRGSCPDDACDSNYHRAFRAEQVATVFRNSVTSLLASLGIAPLIALALWSTGSEDFLLAWIGAVYAVTLARLAHYLAFRRSGPGSNGEAWHLGFIAGAFVGGAVWGAPWAFFPSDDMISWLFVGLSLAGMAMAATSSYFVSPAAFRAYSVPVLVPYAIANLVHHGDIGISLALLSVIFLVAMDVFARSACGVFSRAVLEHLRNAELVERVSRARAEAEEANRAKSDFLANMSHELRTPLNAIIGFSDIMRKQIFGPIGNSTYKDYAEDINASGTHLLALVNDILDLSKAEAGQMVLNEDDVDMDQTLGQAMQMVRGQADALGIALSTSNHCRGVSLHADPRHMMQILLNLVANGIRFIEGKGRVDVDASLDPATGEYVLTVADNGIGMEPHEIPLAMARFGQVHADRRHSQPGTGLGLTLVRHMVDLHGGSIRIDSARGVGTTVEIRFPASRVIAPSPLNAAGSA
ncbi:MAG: HAMP domain-containing sensor histidine kinase [Alphaproteobacteria bacterium]